MDIAPPQSLQDGQRAAEYVLDGISVALFDYVLSYAVLNNDAIPVQIPKYDDRIRQGSRAAAGAGDGGQQFRANDTMNGWDQTPQGMHLSAGSQ